MSETLQERTARHQDAFTIVRWLSFVLANGRIYGITHKITRQSMNDAALALQAFLQCHGELEFSVCGEDFQVEDETLAPAIPGTVALAKYLIGLRITTLTVQRDIANAEILAFLAMLFNETNQLQSTDSFSERLEAAGLTRIQSTAYAYRRVKEGDTIVSKADTAQTGLDDSVVAVIQSLMDGGGADGVADALSRMDLDSEAALSEMVRIAMPPGDADRLGPAEVARQAIDRLERMSDGLLNAPGNRTQKGRKAIRKLIKNVEAEVTDRLQRLGADIQAMETLASRVKDLIEELAMDGLVAQYLKLRGEMVDQEKKLTRRIQRVERRGDDAGELKSRLVELGMPADIIETLRTAAQGEAGRPAAAKSDQSPTGAPEVALGQFPSQKTSPEPETPLSDLLKKLRQATPGDGRLPPVIGDILAEMNKTLQQTAIRVEAQMKTFKRVVETPVGQADSTDLSRRQLLALMAELGQELRQPLTVISGAVDMLLGRYFGAIANEQVPILEMAAESGRTLDEMIGRMIHIAGLPTSLNPDATILARIK